MKKTGKTRRTRWLSCMVTLSLCLGSLGAAGAAPTKAEPELSTGGHPLIAAASVPETVRELIGLEADAPQKVVQTDNLYEILTENEDGSGQGTLFAAPVKYIDEDGQAQFIDSSIVPKGFFRSLLQSYTYTNAANSVQVEYSKDSAKGVRLNGGVIMAVADTKQPDDMPGFVREEAGKDDVFVYPQAFGPDTYVEYSNTAGGVKENIVLEKNVGRNEFAFTLETATHTPVLSADNTSITLVSKTNPGEGDYLISSLYVYDSYQPDGTETAEDFRHYTEDCLYRLEAVEESVYKITAVVSQAFLNHPETVYPVVIDPTVSGTASTMDDAFISPTVTGASNYKASYLRVGKNGNDHYAYLRFGNLPSKPANVDVSSATLKLTYRPNQTTGGVLDCYYVGSSWVGKDLTWNNQPSRYAPGSTYDPQGRNYSIASFDVATHLQNWTNGGYNNYGLCISYNNLSMNDYNSVYSSDGPAASVPRIEYSYTGAYGATSGISSGTIYYLRNVRSGKYMDVQGGGTNVVQYSFHGDANQQWKFVYAGDGYYSIIPVFKPGLRLDVGNANDINGTNIGIHQDNGSNAQKFRVLPCAGDCYRLLPKISTKKVVEVAGGSSENSANVRIWDYGPARQHEWYIEKVSTKLNGYKTFSAFDVGDSSENEIGVIQNLFKGLGYKQVCALDNKNGYIPAQTIKDVGSYSDFIYMNGHGGAYTNMWIQDSTKAIKEYLCADVSAYSGTDRPKIGIGATLLPGSTTKTNSFWNLKTKWGLFAECNQLSYDSYGAGPHWNGLSSAQIWARTMLGDGQRVHGYLGYYTQAPSAAPHYKTLDFFAQRARQGQPIVSAWTGAHMDYFNQYSTRINYACIYHTANISDTFNSFTASTPNGSNYEIGLMSRVKNKTLMKTATATAKSIDQVKDSFTLKNRSFSSSQKKLISQKLLSARSNAKLNIQEDCRLSYQSGLSCIDGTITEYSLTDEQAIAIAIQKLTDLGLMPTTDYRAVVDRMEIRLLNSPDLSFSAPKTVEYTVRFYKTYRGIDIVTNEGDGITLRFNKNGFSDINYYWRDILETNSKLSHISIQKESAITAFQRDYPVEAQNAPYVSQAFVMENGVLKRAWVVGTEPDYVNAEFFDMETGDHLLKG